MSMMNMNITHSHRFLLKRRSGRYASTPERSFQRPTNCDAQFGRILVPYTKCKYELSTIIYSNPDSSISFL